MCQKNEDRYFLQQAIDLAVKNVESQGGPFAAIVVKDGKIVATGANRVTANNDPTAHAEVTAIRNACSQLNAFQLEGCTIYASCEPCPMCLGAIYWARPARLVFAADRFQAADAGFDDEFIYQEINLKMELRHLKTIHITDLDSSKPLEMWKKSSRKIDY